MNKDNAKSVYIHIPFCKAICSYCDFCKVLYNKKWISDYFQALKQEIELNYKNELIKTIYIGGGTPSILDIEELKTLFEIVKIFNFDKEFEFTFECNIDSITLNKLLFLYENKVNRISIGIESFNKNNLKFVNRMYSYETVKSKIAGMKKIGFNNINIDLIYALPNQTIDSLKNDLDLFIKLDVNHISTYSLMIEPHTKLYIENVQVIDEDNDYEMYTYIVKYLKQNGYTHYEISNFSKIGFESKHNLTYWNNLPYYGFGLGASGYINGVRYDNTKSLTNYLKGKYHLKEDKLTKHISIENELILGFRKMNGINKKDFYNKFGIKLEELNVIKKMLGKEKLIENERNIYINPKYIYISNEILVDFIGEV